MPSAPSASLKRSSSSANDGDHPTDSSQLIPVTICYPQRRPRGTRGFRIPRVRAVLALPDGTHLASRPKKRRAQNPATSTSTPAAAGPSAGPSAGSSTTDEPNTIFEPTLDDDPDETPSTGGRDPLQVVYITPGDAMSTTRRKKLRQYQVWTHIVLPALLPRYLRYLRQLRSPELPTLDDTPPCTCGQASRALQVTCVYFDRAYTSLRLLNSTDVFTSGMEKIVIHTCKCSTAPRQLFGRGLFACAPTAPSVAVDMRLLQFCRETFVRMPPNITGWSAAVEALLLQRGIRLGTKVCYVFF